MMPWPQHVQQHGEMTPPSRYSRHDAATTPPWPQQPQRHGDIQAWRAGAYGDRQVPEAAARHAGGAVHRASAGGYSGKEKGGYEVAMVRRTRPHCQRSGADISCTDPSMEPNMQVGVPSAVFVDLSGLVSNW